MPLYLLFLLLPLFAVSAFIAVGVAVVAPISYSRRKRTAASCIGFLFVPAAVAFIVGVAELFKK